jgi:hypothetical protein
MTRPVVESTLFRARRRLSQEYEEIASGQRCEQVHAVVDAGGPKAVRALGVREHRRLARHVAHCQPCRRYAWAAGVDESVLKPPSIAEKIAALLPIPAFLRWRRHGSNGDASSASTSHPFASLQSATQAVTQLAGPGSPVAGLGRVAAAVAAVAVAGGGVVAGISTTQQVSKPSQHKLVASHSGGGPSAVVAEAHRIAGARAISAAGGKAAIASKSATASKKSGSASTTISSATSSTSSGQPVAHSSLTPPASSPSAGTSSTAAKIPSLPSPSSPSLPNAQLPSLPKAQVPPLPSVDVSSVTKTATDTASSTVNKTLGLVNSTLTGK